MTGYLLQAFIYLVAAVVVVPVAKRLGLGSVLGYLIAGVLIGPVMNLVGSETETIQHFAEFGVVIMLFLVGLELAPRALWNMRHKLIGLGGLQVGVTVLFVTGCAILLGQVWTIALTIGLIFSLSSTAIVLQTLQEKGLQKTRGGQNAFSILLFQDIAVILMLALIPLLALPELAAAAQSGDAQSGHASASHWLTALPGWAYGLVVIGAIAAVIIIGHYFSRSLFRFVAASGLRETFTATALMLVIGIAALMNLVGLSPALGTFLAGVVLANSEFRHELESAVEPFKGLLLGLFFITVGAGINVEVLLDNVGVVTAITLAVIVVKAFILAGLSRLFSIRGTDRWLVTLSLAQAGEFGFVLVNYALQNHVIPPQMAQLLSLVVALSMFLTPGLFILYETVIAPRYTKKSNAQQPDVPQETGTVVIAGIGRFGQIVNRLLVANGVATVVLDVRAEQVALMRRINTKAYFGNASKPDILHTAGIEEAQMMVIAIDDREASVSMVKYLKSAMPHITILARAFDRGHGYRLRYAGADYTVSETYHSALEMGAEALRQTGLHPSLVEQRKTAYLDIEHEQSDGLYAAWADDASGERIDNNYLKLFMQLETRITEAMQQSQVDARSAKAPSPDQSKNDKDTNS